MKTTELIEKLNNVARTITAKVSDNKIIIVNTADIGWGKLASFPMFIISTRATEVSDGTSYAANWTGLNLVNIGRIFNLLEEYVTTSQEDRLEEKKYYLKTASPLVSEQTQYLNYNRLSEKYFYSSVYNDEDHIKYIFTQTEVDNMDTTGLIPEPITDSEEG